LSPFEKKRKAELPKARPLWGLDKSLKPVEEDLSTPRGNVKPLGVF